MSRATTPPRRLASRRLALAPALVLAGALLPGAAPAQGPGDTALDAGRLLIASERLRDPNFARTVVLLVEFNVDGALGLILNRPTEIEVARAIPELADSPDGPAHFWKGGPVSPTTAMALIRSPKAPRGARSVLDGLWLGNGRELVLQMVRHTPPGDSRLYLGYAGWAAGQLELEVAAGGWHVLPATVEAVFDNDPRRSWERLLLTARAQWASRSRPPDYGVGGTLSQTIAAWSIASPPRPRYSATRASITPSG